MYYQHPTRDYRVVVGHNTVYVRGRSRDEALQNARMRLCADMPRMWDVIEHLDARSFSIEVMDDRLS